MRTCLRSKTVFSVHQNFVRNHTVISKAFPILFNFRRKKVRKTALCFKNVRLKKKAYITKWVECHFFHIFKEMYFAPYSEGQHPYAKYPEIFAYRCSM